MARSRLTQTSRGSVEYVARGGARTDIARTLLHVGRFQTRLSCDVHFISGLISARSFCASAGNRREQFCSVNDEKDFIDYWGEKEDRNECYSAYSREKGRNANWPRCRFRWNRTPGNRRYPPAPNRTQARSQNG